MARSSANTSTAILSPIRPPQPDEPSDGPKCPSRRESGWPRTSECLGPGWWKCRETGLEMLSASKRSLSGSAVWAAGQSVACGPRPWESALKETAAQRPLGRTPSKPTLKRQPVFFALLVLDPDCPGRVPMEAGAEPVSENVGWNGVRHSNGFSRGHPDLVGGSAVDRSSPPGCIPAERSNSD